MRIALLALHFAEYVSRLAVALSAKHDVLVVLSTRGAQGELTPELRRLVEQSANVEYIDVPRLRDPRLLFSGLSQNRIIRRFSPNVLHVQEVNPLLGCSAVLSWHKRIPLVLTVHDPICHSGEATVDGLGWKLLMWLRRRASRLIVHGPRMQAELEALDRRVAGRVDVIPHGELGRSSIDDDLFESEPSTFLFFGRIEPYKGLRYLLDAADVLRNRGHVLKLIVAGTGTDLERHRERIASSPGVELIDRYVPATDVGGLFRRSTAVVLPYTDATQSGVAAIAFGNSRPVIASALGDLTDIVIHGRTGLIVPPRDAMALAAAMERLLVDRGLRDSLAAGAGRHAREKLSWARIAELTEGAYGRAIEACHLGRAARLSAADESS